MLAPGAFRLLIGVPKELEGDEGRVACLTPLDLGTGLCITKRYFLISIGSQKWFRRLFNDNDSYL